MTSDGLQNWIAITDLSYRQERIGGNSARELKSAIQKYLRRGEVNHGLRALAALDSCIHIELDAKHKHCSRAKALRTNTVNRLVVMMSEEINVNAPTLPLLVKQWYTSWQKTGRSDSKESFAILHEWYATMASQPKCRLISDFKTVFNLAPYYDKSDNCGAELRQQHRGLLDEFSSQLDASLRCDAYLELPMAKKWELFEDALLKRSLSCFAVFSALCFSSSRGPRGVETTAWDVFFGLLRRSDVKQELAGVVEALHFFYKTMNHQEKPIYLYHALQLFVWQEKFDFATTPAVGAGQVASPESIMVESPVNLKLHSYCIDIHTASRKVSGKDELTFALEGALIVNEATHTPFYNATFRAMYIRLKEILAGRTAPALDAATNATDAPAAAATEPSTEESRDAEEDRGTVPVVLEEAPISIQPKLEAVAASPSSRLPPRIATLIEMLKVPVHPLSQAARDAIHELPHAQRLTGRGKKAVFVGGFFVFKGPFRVDEEKLFNNLASTLCIKALLEECQAAALATATVPNQFNTLLPWTAVHCGEVCEGEAANQKPVLEVYLECPNVGSRVVPDRCIRTVSTKIEEKVRVIDRGEHVLRVSEVPTSAMTRQLQMQVLQHLYVLHLLDVGDNGTHNMLLTHGDTTAEEPKRAVGIDHEEKRQPPSTSATQFEVLLKKGGSAAQRQLFSGTVPSIAMLPSQLGAATIAVLEAAEANPTRVRELGQLFAQRKLM